MKRNRAGGRTAAASAVVLMSALCAGASRARAGDGETAETVKHSLVPTFTAGEQFRIERRYRQMTMTATGAVGRGRGGAQIDPMAYDASLQVDALVTVEKVDAKGLPQEWSAKLDRLRVDIPDPIQTQAYRLRARERKQKRLMPNAHPLEGVTVRLEQKADGKARLSKVLKSGADAGISERYPEVIPIMQSFVDPDWSAAAPMAVGAEWEVPADQIFRLTKVLAKTPLTGTLKCRLTSVTEGTALIDFTAELSETYATAEMRLDVVGTIEFDVVNHRQIGNSYKGRVTVSAKGSSLAGTGTIDGGNVFTVATAPEDDSEK